jgi:hypothetical protein
MTHYLLFYNPKIFRKVQYDLYKKEILLYLENVRNEVNNSIFEYSDNNINCNKNVLYSDNKSDNNSDQPSILALKSQRPFNSIFNYFNDYFELIDTKKYFISTSVKFEKYFNYLRDFTRDFTDFSRLFGSNHSFYDFFSPSSHDYFLDNRVLSSEKINPVSNVSSFIYFFLNIKEKYSSYSISSITLDFLYFISLLMLRCIYSVHFSLKDKNYDITLNNFEKKNKNLLRKVGFECFSFLHNYFPSFSYIDNI